MQSKIKVLIAIMLLSTMSIFIVQPLQMVGPGVESVSK